MFGRSNPVETRSASRSASRLDYVRRHPRRCGGGGGDQRRRVEFSCRVGQPEVVGAEVMTPLGNAVRLVDDEQPHIGLSHLVEEPCGREALGCDVEELELPGNGVVDGGVVGIAVLLRVHERHLVAEPARGQRLDLVLHERHER